MKLFRIVAAQLINPEDYGCYEVPAPKLVGAEHAGMDLLTPGCPRCHYKGKDGHFWFTAHGWKSLRMAEAARKQGFQIKVKVVKARKSDIIWTDGIQAIARRS